MTSELKPCPFCGGKAIYHPDHTTEATDSIYCQSCDATVSDFNLEGPQGSCRELWNTRAPAPAVKVKALVWQRNGDHHAGGHGYVIRKMGRQYTLTVRNKHGQNFDNLAAAKAAAQADYEARILAALEPTPAVDPMSDPRVVNLVEALRCMVYETTSLSPEEGDGSHWCKISRAALTEARAALAALDTP